MFIWSLWEPFKYKFIREHGWLKFTRPQDIILLFRRIGDTSDVGRDLYLIHIHSHSFMPLLFLRQLSAYKTKRQEGNFLYAF